MRTYLEMATRGILVAAMLISPVSLPIPVSLRTPTRAPLRAQQTPLSKPQAQTVQQPIGATHTILADGRILVAGGEGPSGSTAAGFLQDPTTGTTVPLASSLVLARAWHSATMLPNGTVLIFGGIGTDGKVVEFAESFDPVTLQFHAIPTPGLTPRARHTATLLTDGRVFIAGGVSTTGQVLGQFELWDAKAQTLVGSSLLPAGLRDHTAKLLPDGTVLLWDGTGESGAALNFGEVFDPKSKGMRIETNPPPDLSVGGSPLLEESVPGDGQENVAVNITIALRFSKPLSVTTVNSATISLSGPEATVSAKVVSAEGGMLAFVTPNVPLVGGTNFTLSIAGPTDPTKLALPNTVISFKTAGETPGAETGIVGMGSLSVTGDPMKSPFLKLPPLQAPLGETALAGQVLKMSGAPLSDVTIQIDNKRVQTDDTGRFLLRNLDAGHQVMNVDPRTVNEKGVTYGFFAIGVDITEKKTNALPFTVWLPILDTAHATTFSSPTKSEVVATTPLIPGLEVHIPANDKIVWIDGKPVTSLTITPLSMMQMPMPGPPGVEMPLFFTIQPDAAIEQTDDGTVGPGIRIVYPNVANYRPGARVNYWTYDPKTAAGWSIYGQGTVTPDGKQITPDRGVVIHRFTCAFFQNQPNPPGSGPPPGGAPPGPPPPRGGEPVDLATGLFVYEKTDFVISDVLPITLSRTYRPSDNISRSFGIGATDSFDIYLHSNYLGYVEFDLILANGSQIRYFCASGCGSGGTPTFLAKPTPSMFYGSKMVAVGNSWQLTLKDGTSYFFDINQGCLQKIQDRNGNQLTITRDNSGSGKVTQVTSPNGRWIKFTYDGSNRITQVQDMIGRTVGYAYDASGRLYTVTDANNGVTSYTYDPTTNAMLTVKDPRQIVYLTNLYDANGRVQKQTLADNSSTYQFAYTLDGNGNVTETDVTDPRNYVRKVTFNSDGYMTSDTHAFGHPEQQTNTYTLQPGSNLILSATDALNRQTAYTYDAMGNLTSVTRLAGTSNAVTTSFTYDPVFNQLTAVTDPLGYTTAFSHDSKGNVNAVTDPLENQVTIVNNSAGQPVSTTDPLGNTTQFAYDTGDLVSITDPLNRVTTRFFDSVGRLISATNPLGQSTKMSYDGLNDMLSVTDPLNGMTSFGYDGNGNQLRLADANQHSTTYTYDSMDRVQTRKDALLNQESYVYDGNGNLTQFTDRRGKVTTYNYDGLNRRTFAGFGTTAGPTYESTISYSYDAGSRLSSVADSGTGTITPTFDLLDRLTQEQSTQGAVSYGYDAAGRRTSMTVAGQTAVNYSYNNANRLTGMTQGTSTSVSFTYDSANRRTSLTLPNGVTMNYSYDNASQLTGITYTNGSTSLGTLSYANDLAGRRSNLGGSLAQTQTPLPISTIVYNANNQLTTWGTANLFYDANGNMTSDGTNSYTWNARNQLASMNFNNVSFQYDGYGRRTGKTISGYTTNYLYDDANPVQELSGSTVTANLLTGLRVDERFTRTDAIGSANFLTDPLGSTVALTDNSGNTLATYAYQPFGNTTVTSGSSANRYEYTGRENDGTGVYFYRKRYYSPTLQRFISEDPIGIAGGIDLYAYVSNSPVNFNDPLGQDKNGGGSGGSGTPPPPPAPTPDPCPCIPAFGAAALSQAGTTAQTGLDLSMLITAPNYALMAAVALPEEAVSVLDNVLQVGRFALQNPSYWGAASDFVQGFGPGAIPVSAAGFAGAMAGQVSSNAQQLYDGFKQLLGP
jgi:RHS repeat-associated protein